MSPLSVISYAIVGRIWRSAAPPPALNDTGVIAWPSQTVWFNGPEMSVISSKGLTITVVTSESVVHVAVVALRTDKPDTLAVPVTVPAVIFIAVPATLPLISIIPLW